MPHPSLSQRGVSVIEVMVAIVLLSAMVFGFLGGVNAFYRSMNDLTEGNEIENAMLRLTGAFGDSEDYCISMLTDPNCSDFEFSLASLRLSKASLLHSTNADRSTEFECHPSRKCRQRYFGSGASHRHH